MARSLCTHRYRDTIAGGLGRRRGHVLPEHAPVRNGPVIRICIPHPAAGR